jgi:hypothetical protein
MFLRTSCKGDEKNEVSATFTTVDTVLRAWDVPRTEQSF